MGSEGAGSSALGFVNRGGFGLAGGAPHVAAFDKAPPSFDGFGAKAT